MATFLQQHNNAFNVSNVDSIDTISHIKDYLQGEHVTVVTLRKGVANASFVSKNELDIEQILEIIRLAGQIDKHSVSWDKLESEVVNRNR